MHKLYEVNLSHKADFRVKYKFYTPAECGRTMLPSQGYRSDFWYPHEGGNENRIFMIHPQFEDENGDVILETNRSVKENGTAKMWIVMPMMREYHKTRIIIGTKGYFKEGPNTVAECEVIEIIGLLENPTN